MFSKEESKRLRQEFWISFGKSFPRKWILYDTKIKGLTLKFHFELKKAMVSLDIDHSDLGVRIELWDKLLSLESIVKNDYLPEVIFNDSLILDNGKEISRAYVALTDVSIHNKNTWRDTMEFLNDNMLLLEAFFMDYRQILEN
ncbi:DUF4268 domain-containing protein [Maribacter polysiphoniae]|uniref:DUF4268 domain-containing protein n=1 Tax=Maribacter polysiphoniae TaxID=429344 RepID=A0A316DVF1_9FLAO|nr:DUF4268 domain-containing protein [Maribacter polysiphoniae]MBD1262986.1 DUF4268 domain-containing protein [Maribacter polysiphoniae]PWK22081.1 uncharacterized protein DUF4268 [Maribacter polysiphoniae]